jgi:hypothetical protein
MAEMAGFAAKILSLLEMIPFRHGIKSIKK